MAKKRQKKQVVGELEDSYKLVPLMYVQRIQIQTLFL